jgi:hypothetical protein
MNGCHDGNIQSQNNDKEVLGNPELEDQSTKVWPDGSGEIGDKPKGAQNLG